MYVSHKFSVVFVRVPKTGSTSVFKGYTHHHGPWDKYFQTHLMPHQLERKHKEALKDYRWIAGIRHPMTWLPSLHRWLFQGHRSEERTRWTNFRVDDPNDHKSFLRAIRWTPMDWVHDPEGIVDVEPYRLEDAEDFIEEALRFRMTHHNPTDVLPEFNWDDDDLEYIGKKFEREFKFYTS